jgi:hypothetical protein
MKKLLLILLCLPMIGFGQGWEQTYGGTSYEFGYSIQQTTDGGYIICGNTESFGNGMRDVYLIKTDGSGSQQWSQSYGGSGTDVGYSVQQTNDGGYIISGSTESFGNGGHDVYIIKTDNNGDQQWFQTFGGSGVYDRGRSVQQTNDGGYIIGGSTTSFGNSSDVYLIKTDGNGNQLWSKTYNEGSTDYGVDVKQTTDGGYVVCGYSNSIISNGNFDIYLIKSDNNGNEEWSSKFGGAGVEHGYSVQQTTDGGYIISGYTDNINTSNYDVYLIKTDGNGNQLWSQTYGGSGYNEGKSVQQTNDGGYIICGYTESFGNGMEDVYLIKTDGNGNEIWSQRFGGADNDQGWSVQQTTDGGYIISGYTESFGNGDRDIYIIKTDANGNITSTFDIPIDLNRNIERVVDILGRETKEKKNTPLFYIYDDGTVEKKITID